MQSYNVREEENSIYTYYMTLMPCSLLNGCSTTLLFSYRTKLPTGPLFPLEKREEEQDLLFTIISN